MAESMMLYWGSGSPPCWRVLIALEEKNLQGFQHKLLSFDKGEHKSEEVMKLNPRGQLPTFKHGDVVVNESFAACLYLENQFKSQGTQLIPDDVKEQALVLQRAFEALALQQKMYDSLFYDYFVPEPERQESALKRHMENLKTEVTLWEGYLQKMGKGSFLAGRNFSMADVIFFPIVAFLPDYGLSKERYPNLMEYYEMLKERPSIKASWPPHWADKATAGDTLKDL
ncbi:glutathione S-transferase A-like isoform X1 [Neoarius graeffei]|uniref:glutathione S-transferase A-like isoform X1 n=1 Tax=Neoarius graeffei TaxID=443677 RepID=UPI00298C89D7|nr:glutathione S-transferase A-like isoform X1 [Neoarius graeffei]